MQPVARNRHRSGLLCTLCAVLLLQAPGAGADAYLVDDDDAYWNADVALPDGGLIPAALAQLFRVYYGALGRLPDAGGFAWWAGEIAAGRHDLRSMAAGFIDSDEFRLLADADLDGVVSSDELVTHMYVTVFGRQPDPGGYNWWMAELESGRRSPVDVLVEMTQSNEYVQLTLAAVAEYLPEGGPLGAEDRERIIAVLSGFGGEAPCDTAGLADGDVDASAAINRCIADAPAYTTLSLAPGRYRLDSPIVIDRPLYLRTRDTGVDSPACASAESASCATLVAGPQMLPSAASRGFVDTRSQDVVLGHLVIDGNRAQRLDSEAASRCRDGDNGFGFSASTSGDELTLFSSVIQQTLCGTGLVVFPNTQGHYIVNNVVTTNGVHDTPGLWADGMTVLDVAASAISRNRFVDNTDIDFILGGCQDCEVADNEISHSDRFVTSAFAGLMLYNFFDTTSGNFTGSVVSGNRINCSNKRCGFGLYIGQISWTGVANPLYGGVVENNSIDGAMLGFNVDQTTGSVAVRNNSVSNSGGVHNTSCGARFMGAYNISPASVVDRSGDAVPDSAYEARSYAGCIPNFSATRTVGQCAATQEAPAWGEKDGMCLLACGALGGSVALASPCDTQGLIDVGEAYDVPYCCAALDDL